ncbi:hypothetical protein ACFPRL_05440 [Pseudoclavibacter helvolus]
MACTETSYGAASSPTVASPPASLATMSRRVGSARAAKTGESASAFMAPRIVSSTRWLMSPSWTRRAGLSTVRLMKIRVWCQARMVTLAALSASTADRVSTRAMVRAPTTAAVTSVPVASGRARALVPRVIACSSVAR